MLYPDRLSLLPSYRFLPPVWAISIAFGCSLAVNVNISPYPALPVVFSMSPSLSALGQSYIDRDTAISSKGFF